MSSYHVQVTEPAEKDLYEIGMYIAKELLEPETAKRIISKIAEAIRALEYMPLKNSVVKDERLVRKNIRRIIVGNYIVFYIVAEESKTVTVVRILYNRRDWINVL